MATFQTSADNQQRPIGIGDQRTVQTGETGFGNVVNTLTQVGTNLVNEGVSRHVEAKSQQIVSNAMEEADAAIAGQAGLDDIANNDPAVQGVRSNAGRLQRAVDQGRIPREHARLLVSNSVVKAIEEQPWLSRQIRQSASNLLGFDPKSEGVRQFFASFDTRDELMAAERARAAKETPLQKAYARTSAYISDPQQAMDEARNILRLEDESKALQQEVQIGDMKSEQVFGKYMQLTRNDATRSVFSMLKAAEETGVDIEDPKAIEASLAEMRNSSWAAMEQTLRSNPNGVPSVTQMSKFRAEHDAQFNTLATQVKELGPKALLDTKVDMLSALSTVYAHNTLPQLKFLNDQFPRVAEKVYDALIAGANPTKYEALIKAEPGLKPFIDMARQTPEKFKEAVFGSIDRLARGQGTAEDKGIADWTIKNVVPTLEPDQREKVLESLMASGVKASVTKSIASRPVIVATKKEKQLMKDEWANIQATQPQAVAAKLTEARTSLTGRDVKVSLSQDGKSLNVTRRMMTPAGLQEVGIEGEYPELMKINRMLQAADNGWAAELKIDDVKAKAVQILGQINGIDLKAKQERLAELEAKRAAAVERRKAEAEQAAKDKASFDARNIYR